MSEANKALVRRYQDAFNRNRLEELDAIVAMDVVTHSQAPGAPPGLEGAKAVHRQLLQAYPDLHVEIDELVAEGDTVAARFTVTGTDKGGSFGFPPTGRSYRIPGVSFFRIRAGRVVEHWGLQDVFGLMVQLGHLPAPQP
jgi:steroid delta-isomerase-like uncharacterized protein